MGDVTIRGAGIFGLSIAWTCARRGASVQVIDPNGPGAGASGGVLGALAPHVPENWNPKKQFQFDSLIAAQSFWAEVQAVGGVDPGYGRLGRLQPIPDTAALERARTRGENAKALWQGQAAWQVIPVADAGDWAPPSPTGHLIRDTLSARLHPRQAAAALLAALSVLGVSVTPEGADRGQVLWATGVADLAAISAALDKTGGRPIGNGVKGQAALLEHDPGPVPQVFVDGVHIVAHGDGTTAIGSTSERVFDDAHTTDAQLEDLIARARAAMPVLRDARVIERWAGVRPRTRSRAPMLGDHPLHKGQFIANGGFKIGFGMAPGVAEVMADLMLEGRDTIPEGFRPDASL